MNNNCNANISKKAAPSGYFSNPHSLHSHKKLSAFKSDRYYNSQSHQIKPDLKALIQIVPSDQRLIQQYIEELKDKLHQLRNSPRKKLSSRIETEQIFRRKYSQCSKSKSKKSNDRNQSSKSIVQSVNFLSAKKNTQVMGLNDFKEVRDEFKRSKQRILQRRVVTEKQSHRYSQGKISRTDSKHPQIAQSCNIRMRSNTQQIIRSQNNPARLYRYSSLKKPSIDDANNINNNYIFDKIISVQQNINIYPSEGRPNKERLRRQQGQNQHQSQSKQSKPSPKKLTESNEVIGKIQDLSTINAKKETLNFLGESCLDLKRQFQQKQQKQTSKILDFIEWKTGQMKKVLTNLKQKKRKTGLDKLGKIFPKGFFI